MTADGWQLVVVDSKPWDSATYSGRTVRLRIVCPSGAFIGDVTLTADDNGDDLIEAFLIND